MPAPSPLYAAGYLLGLVTAALGNAVTAGTLSATLATPGDWDTPATALDVAPSIKYRTGLQRKSGLREQGPVIFESMITIELQAQCSGATAAAAQAAVFTLGAAIEQAIFTSIFALDVAATVAATGKVSRNIKRVAEANEQVRISAKGRDHLAELDLAIAFELYEQFQPVGVPLTEIQVTASDPVSGDTLVKLDLTNLNA